MPLVQAPCSSSPRPGGAGRAKHRSLSSLSRPRAPSRTLAPLWGRLPPGFGATAVPVRRHREPFPSLPVGTSWQILSLPSPGSWQPGICGEGGSRWGPSCQLMPQRGSARPPHTQSTPSWVLTRPGVPLQLLVSVPPQPNTGPWPSPPVPSSCPRLWPRLPLASRSRRNVIPVGTRGLCASRGLEGGTKPPSHPPAPTAGCWCGEQPPHQGSSPVSPRDTLGPATRRGERGPRGHAAPGEGRGVPGAECHLAAAGFGLFQQLPAARGMLLGPGHGALNKLFIALACPGTQRLHSSRMGPGLACHPCSPTPSRPAQLPPRPAGEGFYESLGLRGCPCSWQHG